MWTLQTLVDTRMCCGQPCRHYMSKLLPLVQSKKYDVADVISHRLPLSEGVEAYRLFDGRAPGCTKVVMRPWSEAAAADGVEA